MGVKFSNFSGEIYTIISVVNNAIRTTKKVLLAFGVIFVYVLYTMVLRGQHSGPVLAPSSNSGAGNGSSSGSTGSVSSNTTSYKDGTYTGSVANAFYGNVQVQVTVSGGKITNVDFLQYPNDNPNSQSINQQATPYLKQEAIQAQSANVNTISGATLTSNAFVQSMSSALGQAKA